MCFFFYSRVALADIRSLYESDRFVTKDDDAGGEEEFENSDFPDTKTHTERSNALLA